MSDDKETIIYHPNSPDGDDGCKDCCSFFLGAFSLTGLVAVLVPMLIHEWRKYNDRE